MNTKLKTGFVCTYTVQTRLDAMRLLDTSSAVPRQGVGPTVGVLDV